MIRAEVLIGIAAALVGWAWSLRAADVSHPVPNPRMERIVPSQDSLFETGSLGVPEEP